MKKTCILFLVLMLTIGNCLFAQGIKQLSSRELISISANSTFSEALRAIESISQRTEGKKVINLTKIEKAIGYPINQMYWKDALHLLADINKLTIEERPGSFVISEPAIASADGKPIFPDEVKQVRISSIFFKADKSLASSIGIDWSTLFNGQVVTNLKFSGASKVTDDVFNASTSTRMESGDYKIDLNTLLKIVENNQKGSVIARPNLIVMSGKEGSIQVGQDFSIKQTDESGNVTDKFFSTGIIMNVKPEVQINQDGSNSIHLTVKVEKSSATPGQISTIVNKSNANTEVNLFDGEETVIGGLYDTDDTRIRTGIPILKDLPWWVFGIKYLTGYNKIEKNTREMIIILKAEVVKPISQRINDTTPIESSIDFFRNNTKEKTEILRKMYEEENGTGKSKKE